MRDTLVIDTETGGLTPEVNGLCSVAMKVLNEDIYEYFFIKPNKSLTYDEKALQINGLTLEGLEEKGITEEEAVERIIKFTTLCFPGRRPLLLGQNVVFDIGFLKALFKRHNKNFDDYIFYHFKDTMIITNFLKESERIPSIKANLTSSYKYFTGLEPDNAHNALGDVLMTEKVYNKQLQLMKEINHD